MYVDEALYQAIPSPTSSLMEEFCCLLRLNSSSSGWFWWQGRNLSIYISSFVSQSWVTERPVIEKIHEDLIMRGCTARQLDFELCDMRLFDKLTRPLLPCNMFKSSDIGSCIRRTGLEFTLKPHTIETSSLIFLQDSSPLVAMYDATRRQLAAA